MRYRFLCLGLAGNGATDNAQSHNDNAFNSQAVCHGVFPPTSGDLSAKHGKVSFLCAVCFLWFLSGLTQEGRPCVSYIFPFCYCCSRRSWMPTLSPSWLRREFCEPSIFRAIRLKP